jgi:hypothetical protein
MTTPDEPESRSRVRCRSVGHLDYDDISLSVAHVFAAEGESGKCTHCGENAHDEGGVGLAITGITEDGQEVTLDALMAPEDALLLANRLTRAANMALESGEDLPDIEREMAKFGARQ